MAILKCESCGAKLKTKKGNCSIVCDYCGCETIVNNTSSDIETNKSNEVFKTTLNIKKTSKKNPNIVAYCEKYKEKYSLHYAEEGTKLVKRLSILVSVIWCYSFFWMAFAVLSLGANFAHNVLDYVYLKKIFLITVFCTVAMVGASVLFVCKQKIAGLTLAIIAQPFIVYAHKPALVYGMGYRPRFYYAYAIPAVLMVIVCGILLFILIRAIYKTNMIYNYIVEELYKQHGTKNGEKLSDEEWQEFLTNYDPYKPIISDKKKDKSE